MNHNKLRRRVIDWIEHYQIAEEDGKTPDIDLQETFELIDELLQILEE